MLRYKRSMTAKSLSSLKSESMVGFGRVCPATMTVPAFSFTTGFWVNANHPEVIIFSTKTDIAHDVFWDLFRDAKAGKPLPIGERTDAVFANLPAYVFPVAKKHYRDLLGWSRWFYGGEDFPCLQIVWPDRAGGFPWEPDFDPEFQKEQPDLTERGWVNEIAA